MLYRLSYAPPGVRSTGPFKQKIAERRVVDKQRRNRALRLPGPHTQTFLPQPGRRATRYHRQDRTIRRLISAFFQRRRPPKTTEFDNADSALSRVCGSTCQPEDLIKPFSFPAFDEALREWMNRNRIIVVKRRRRRPCEIH
ncbi:hypothetical protein B7486_13630 [cyanobacterium TDX16]|nr:hypothetical protein B7486_13630 [cyanobacterium TDX16]